MASIVVLNDEDASSGTLGEMLEHLKHKLVETASCEDALSLSARGEAQIVLVNQSGECSRGISVLSAFKHAGLLAVVPVVVITGGRRSDEVIEAMRLGAFDHLTRPVTSEDLESVIGRALGRPRQDLATAAAVGQDDSLVGSSSGMRRAEKLIGIAAACDTTVLVHGETGTGKSTVARTIHRHSQLSCQPLTIVDCTAVPEDYESFQSLTPGARGTVILDEIGDLNGQMQAMLVRALKESSERSPQRARLIATTQYDLISMVKERCFREDLYYRLNVLSISLPTLRERGSDILLLAETFLQQARPEAPKQISSAAAKILLDYRWPGNVRELQNLMYHLTVAGGSAVVDPSDLHMIAAETPSLAGAVDDSTDLDYYKAMSKLERSLLERALEQARGSRAEAARLLGINRQLFYSKLKAHGLMDH